MININNGAHCATGVMAGAGATATATALGFVHLPPVVLSSPVTWVAALAPWVVGALGGGGGALLPDWDHDDSAITKSGGPVTRVVAEGLQALSRFVFRCTALRHDRGHGVHRFLLHTWQFAVLVGVLIAAGCWVAPWTGAAVLVVLMSPALRSLAWQIPNELLQGKRKRAILAVVVLRELVWAMRHRFGALCVTIITVYVLVDATGGLTPAGPGVLFGGWAALWFGAIVTGGMITHDAGDSVTNSGGPWKAGIRHRCDRCRAAFIAASCMWRRMPWHRCEHCNAARRRWPTCARWDRNTILPRWFTWSVGSPRGIFIETCISYVCLVSTVGIVGAGIAGVF